jgi:hypothetical protein
VAATRGGAASPAAAAPNAPPPAFNIGAPTITVGKP